jgi:hypothetical protein
MDSRPAANVRFLREVQNEKEITKGTRGLTPRPFSVLDWLLVADDPELAFLISRRPGSRNELAVGSDVLKLAIDNLMHRFA